jgi:transcriptional regulator with XRE-family HTH domain
MVALAFSRTLEKHILTQSALGERIGKDAQYVSKLERRILTSVSTTTLEKLADALECSTDYLLGRVDQPTLA